MDEYECGQCNGKLGITVLEDSEKATEPLIEFCPFCGMSNFLPKEVEEVGIKNKNKLSNR
jgi:hypothetical protein